VRPLLPGSAASLVLVTSRRRLTALEGAIVISIDTLSPDESWALLVRLADRADLELNEAADREITRLCGFLPLAIGMLARRLRADQQRLFRRLGLTLGPDIDAYAAAALDDTSLEDARIVAATAVAAGWRVGTANLRHFDRIAGLDVLSISFVG